MKLTIPNADVGDTFLSRQFLGYLESIGNIVRTAYHVCVLLDQNKTLTQAAVSMRVYHLGILKRYVNYNRTLPSGLHRGILEEYLWVFL